MKQLAQELKIQESKIIHNIEENLLNRGSAQRDRKDDQIFTTFFKLISTSIGAGMGLQQYIITLGHNILAIVSVHEQNFNTQIHKGAIYFNLGLVYYWSRNYDDAQYYFYLANAEDVHLNPTTTPSTILSHPLFVKYVNSSVAGLAANALLGVQNISNQLLGKALDFTTLQNAIGTADPIRYISLLKIIHSFVLLEQRIANEASRTQLYLLIADLCTLFESELKYYLQGKGINPRNTLGAIIRNNLSQCPIGNISLAYPAIADNSYPCRSAVDYNRVILCLLSDIDSELIRLNLAIKLLHLAVITRNQVNHTIDSNYVLYTDYNLAKKVFLYILCSIPFMEYL